MYNIVCASYDTPEKLKLKAEPRKGRRKKVRTIQGRKRVPWGLM